MAVFAAAGRPAAQTSRGWRRAWRWPLVPLAIGALLLFGCGAAPAIPCHEDMRCLRYVISADIPLLDPHLARTPEAGMVFRQLYDTLIYRDPDSREFIPGLASFWLISADGLAYTFHLRQDVLFHDGGRLNASAVARNIERIFSPEAAASLARELLGPLSQFEILDDYTIRLRLYEPYAAFLDGLAQPFLGIASPDALASYDGLRFQYHQAGTGPFQLAAYLPGDSVVLRRFDAYAVKPSHYPPRSADAIERVEIVIARQPESELLRQVGARHDVIDQISPAAAHSQAGNSRIRLLPIPIPGQSMQFVFNTARDRVKDRRLRLALLLATNRRAISDQIFFNVAPVAWAPLSASTGYAHTGFVNEFAFDRAAAQTLLAEAGYADSDGDGILDRAGEGLALTMLAPPWDQLPAVGAFLQAQWRPIGIELKIEPVAGRAELTRLIRSGEYDLLPVDNAGIDPALLNRVFLADSAYTGSAAVAPDLQDRLIDAAQETDPARRRRLYYDIQALLMTEALLLPVSEITRLRAVNAEVVGLRFDAYGYYPLLYNVAIMAR